MLKNVQNCDASTLYEQVADRIRALIQEGTLRSGDRLPSVRKLHQQFSVSISTVLEAYRLLEDQGWVGARPQSGYYVKPQQNRAEPSSCSSLRYDNPVDVSLAFRVMRDPKTLGLGHAIPGLDLLPIASLNRIANRIVREQPTALHSYNAPQGSEVLRHEVARRSIEAGCSFSPDDLIITNGATEALNLALRAVTQPGDIIAIESPTYYGFLEILESQHLKALEIPTEPKEGMLLEHLEFALKHRKIAACLIVSNFSNPLGSCMSDRKKQQLVALLNQYDVPLIEDDVYGELHFSTVRPKAIKAFDTEDRVLYCASVSKTLSPGLRVGWCAAGQYHVKVERLKMAMNWTTAIVPQLTVAEFLSNGGCDRHLRQIRRSYQTQMLRMMQAVCAEFPIETRVTQPNGGQVLWLELPIEFDAMALYNTALQHQITVAPGMMFSPSGAYRNCLRLNCGLPWSTEIETALKTLGRLCKEQLSQH